MKNGFTLIELIFTIVILAITTMAIPRMVAQTAELNILAIQQELVANAKTVVVHVSKAPWDSNCKDGKICNIPAGGSVVVPGGSANKISVARVGDRVDDTANPTAKANFGTGGTGLFADIDDYDVDFNRTIASGSLGAGNTSGDFILNTNVGVTVNYLNEASAGYVAADENVSVNLGFGAGSIAANPTNIKLVEIRATDDTGLGREVILRYYAFNIGMSSMPNVRNR